MQVSSVRVTKRLLSSRLSVAQYDIKPEKKTYYHYVLSPNDENVGIFSDSGRCLIIPVIICSASTLMSVWLVALFFNAIGYKIVRDGAYRHYCFFSTASCTWAARLGWEICFMYFSISCTWASFAKCFRYINIMSRDKKLKKVKLIICIKIHEIRMKSRNVIFVDIF